MNQNSIQNSIQRYSKKRNSYDAIKTSFSLKNPKKSLPEVCIDLNQHHKKNRLALQQRIAKGNQPKVEISQFTDPRKVGKTCKKKDQLTLKNLYTTELMKGQNENKNVLNEYRDQMELLRLDNERLREENQKLKRNEEYYSRRIKEIKLEKKQDQTQLKEYVENLEEKVEKYAEKIKKLYEELIKEKKKGKVTNQQWTKTMISEKNNHNNGRGELYSCRMQPSYHKNQNGKRLTSPSPSHQRQRWTNQVEKLLLFQKRGSEAFYRVNNDCYGPFESSLQ